jgi:hypothetical protein
MRRNKRGSGIIEGVFGLVLIISGGIISTLFILNSGAGIFFRNKTLLVASQAAQYAAAHQADSDVQGETETFVQNLMPTVGMSPSDLKVTVTATTVNGVQGVQVSVSNHFPLFGSGGGVMPDQIRLADTEFASYCVVGSN